MTAQPIITPGERGRGKEEEGRRERERVQMCTGYSGNITQ